MSQQQKNIKKRNIIFLHLDLGIGGAEQLILNLALALHHHNNHPPNTTNTTTNAQDNAISSQSSSKKATIATIKEDSIIIKNDIKIFTTNCNPNHCFDVVKPHPNQGILYNNLYIYGTFIPNTILGYGTALCSTIRMLYLCFIILFFYNGDNDNDNIDVIILDVLPTPIPFIKWINPYCKVLFYCHFPDKLLIRGNNKKSSSSDNSIKNVIRYLYRFILDFIEEYTMSFADLLVVNSIFTKDTVCKNFMSLSSRNMKVLYPSIDMSKFIPPKKQKELVEEIDVDDNNDDKVVGPIISLNRYERKKDIEIIIYAYANYKLKYYKEQNNNKNNNKLPSLIIAGGYDKNNQENISYYKELTNLAYEQLQLTTSEIQFECSISDTRRSNLFQNASCLVYTPENEHFGIVPIEAMYAGIPVIARRSGGPKETVIHGETGLLVQDEDELVQALYDLYNNNSDTDTTTKPKYNKVQMGLNGYEHVNKHFHFDEFQKKFLDLVDECLLLPKTNYRSGCDIRIILIVGFGILLGLTCLIKDFLFYFMNV